MLVVLGILGVLSSLVIPLAELNVQREREGELRRSLWEIRDALDAYQQAANEGAIPLVSGAPPFPNTLEELTLIYPDSRKDHRGQFRRFLREIPRDPFSQNNLPAGQTWAIRGYYSEPGDSKQSGPVYDIHSKSNAIGLNGIPISQW